MITVEDLKILLSLQNTGHQIRCEGVGVILMYDGEDYTMVIDDDPYTTCHYMDKYLNSTWTAERIEEVWRK